MGVSVPTAIQRAYSLLHIKTVDAEQRTIAGLATTPETDRVGDIVESTGARFKNPLSMLMFHDSTKPVAQVTFGKATKDGIPFSATFPDPEQIRSETLRERVLEAWDSVRLKLIRGVSIGFNPLKGGAELLKDGSGYRFTDFEILELSLVVIPANASATIQTIKSLDAEHLAASGAEVPPVVSPSAGASAIRAVKAQTPQKMKTYSDRIKEFEATRQAKRSVDHLIVMMKRAVAKRCLPADGRVQAWIIQLERVSQVYSVDIQGLRKMRALMLRRARTA